MALRRCASRLISLRPAASRCVCSSVKEVASSWNDQLTLSNLGFIDDGGGDVAEVPDATKVSTKKGETDAVRKKRHLHSNSPVVKKFDVSATSTSPVKPTPEEMKQAALEACNILASIAGMQVPRAKKLANGQVSEVSTKQVFDVQSKQFVEVPLQEGEKEEEDFERGSMEVAAGEEHKQETLLVSRHRWPAWIGFLEHIHAKGCFEATEDGIEEDKSIYESDACVRHAVCAFGRHRAHIFKFLSRKDLRILANYGCPDIERKASNASKRLRDHFRIPEGEVCQRCSLKMSCPRAFLAPAAKLPMTTLDAIRIIAGFASKAWLNADSYTSYPEEVESAISKLLKELLAYSELPLKPVGDNGAEETTSSFERLPSKREVVHSPLVEQQPGDWLCPNCEFMNFNRNKRCRECQIFRPPEEEKLPLGDWVCAKCRYANFSKNGFCRMCKTERPTKVQWLGGERLLEGASSEEPPQDMLEEPTQRAFASGQKGRVAGNAKPRRSKTPKKLEKLGEKKYEASDDEGFEARILANYAGKADSGSEMDFNDEEDRVMSQGRSNRKAPKKPMFRWDDSDNVQEVPRNGKMAVKALCKGAPKSLKSSKNMSKGKPEWSSNSKASMVKPEWSSNSKSSKSKPRRNR